MTACFNCGAEIRWATTVDGDSIKIENYPSIRGPNRYREVDYNPLTVQAVTETASVKAYEEHKCLIR